MSGPRKSPFGWRNFFREGVLLLGALGVTLVLAVVLLRALFDTAGGHLGLDLYQLWWGAIPACLVGAIARPAAFSPRSKSIANIVLVSAAFTVAAPRYLEETNLLQRHGQWCEKGMPCLSTRTRVLRVGLFTALFVGTMIWFARAPYRTRIDGMRKHEMGGEDSRPKDAST